MRVPQLSLRIDNKPGCLVEPCRILAQHGINILTLALADQDDHGTLRLIVRDWRKAQEALSAAGLSVTVGDVLAVEVRDEPGGLLELLDIFARAGINVAYMYAITERRGDQAVMLFDFDDLDAAVLALARHGINPVRAVALFEHLSEEDDG